ncbi:MAG: hypothetical protein N3A72_11470, partial [bacterium]|nr:hypothetical protein [bacterium]
INQEEKPFLFQYLVKDIIYGKDEIGVNLFISRITVRTFQHKARAVELRGRLLAVSQCHPLLFLLI